MPEPNWNDHYAKGETPWDIGEPDRELVGLFERGILPRGRALEIGCGTGTNALWLADQGYNVVALDLAPIAIEKALGMASVHPAARCRFLQHDFLAEPLHQGSFDLVFDRGCFHVFDDPALRSTFAQRVASSLAPGGLWVSLIGSTEGPARETGPPRRSAEQVLHAVEPHLQLLSLRASEFVLGRESEPMAWVLVAGLR